MKGRYFPILFIIILFVVAISLKNYRDLIISEDEVIQYGGETYFVKAKKAFREFLLENDSDELKIRLLDKKKTEAMLRSIISDNQLRDTEYFEYHINQFQDLEWDRENNRLNFPQSLIQKIKSDLSIDNYEYSGIEFDLREELYGVNLSRLEKISINDQIMEGKGIFFESSHLSRDAHTEDFLIFFNSSFDSSRVAVSFRLFFFESFISEKYKILSVIGKNGYKEGTFRLPYGTEIFDDLLWTTDCTNENISVFELDGEFVDSFSSYGKGDGYLDTPADIKIDNQKIYVAEERNNRVQIFDLNGEALASFGNDYGQLEKDNNKINLNAPLGVAVMDENILVVDYGNNQVSYFDQNYEPIWVSRNEEDDPYNWNQPYYAEVLNKEVFIITNKEANEVSLITNKGEKLRSFGSDILKLPHEVAVDKDENIYVADTNNFRIVKFLKDSDYSDYSIIDFPVSFGLPKTIAIHPEQDIISVGFIGRGSAYFLVIGDKSRKKNLKKSQNSLSFSQSYTKNSQLSNKFDLLGTYEQHCASCHEGSRYGAPMTGNLEAWEEFPRNIDELTQLAITGNGAMISRGGCYDCTDDELEELIRYMLPKTWYLD
tara:strand:+ start:398 stop:2200 length:1803 start_codon:yes stop_codon:yes gene_type:complete